MEIGSEFFIESKPYCDNKSVFDNNSIKSLDKFLYRYGNYTLTSSGRGAISLLLTQIQPLYKTVLLPEYICESVISPFIKFGYKCIFYKINWNLEPIVKTIEKQEHVGIFLHIGYFGFHTNGKLEETIINLKKNNVIIVEDVTHTLLSTFDRFEDNDYYIASIRKWLGVPSGGMLATKSHCLNCNLKCNEKFSKIRKCALITKGEYIKYGNQCLKNKYLNLFDEAEKILLKEEQPYGIDKTSYDILRKTDVIRIINKRRHNYKLLLDEIRENKYFKIVLNKLPDDVCPMFLPVYVEKDRKVLIQELKKRNIYLPVHWPVSSYVKDIKSDIATEIYETILSITCDQRYTDSHMNEILVLLNSYTNVIAGGTNYD